MSLLRQLFRQKIGKYLTEDLEEAFFPFLRSEKHPPKNLLQDINLLWFTPGDYKEGGGCILECLEDSQYCHTIEDYAENYLENFNCRRAMSPLRSVEYMRNEKIDLNFIKEHSDKNWSNKFLGMKEFRIDFVRAMILVEENISKTSS